MLSSGMENLRPQHDTTAFLDEFRTAQLSHLLTAAVVQFDVGTALSDGPLAYDELCRRLELADRPATVLLTALRSIVLIDVDAQGRIGLTEYGREKLDPNSPFHLRGYIGLGGFSADVQHMVDCLRNDRPAGSVSFVFHEQGPPSALDDPHTADVLTRAMADRARNIAPLLADQLDLSDARCLVDVGGGHGLYSLELLKKHPDLKAIVIDRAPALAVAKEYAEEFGLSDRVELSCGDIHAMVLPPQMDAVLMANILHDYNANDAQALVTRFAKALPPGGRLMILDSFLNAVPTGHPPVSDGPRAVAAYSGLLFSICEGRCFRFDEVQSWIRESGLRLEDEIISVPAHGSVITGWTTPLPGPPGGKLT